MDPVIIESPLAPRPIPEGLQKLLGSEVRRFQGIWDQAEITRHQLYARRLMAWALANGLAPLASHLLYAHPDVLDDRVPSERRLGMRAGFAWFHGARGAVVGLDLHISGGMGEGIARHIHAGNTLYLVQLGIGWEQGHGGEAWRV